MYGGVRFAPFWVRGGNCNDQRNQKRGGAMVRQGKHRLAFHGVCVGLAAAAMFLASRATADQVTSKGTVLHGKITGLSSANVSFEPEYGKGSITIKWDDIEDLKTDGNMQILYGDGEESDAPLQGYSNKTLYTGTGPEGATQIDIATIQSGVAIAPDGPGWRDKLRSAFRYWDGELDFAFNAQQATVDTTGLAIDFKTIRKKDPTRLIFGATYRYATQKDNRQTPAESITQDAAYGIIRGEYDILPRLYGFASAEGTYDAVQQLSIRAIPKLGVGYLFWEQVLDEDHRNFLAGEVSGAWVFEHYFTRPPCDMTVNPGCIPPSPDNEYYAIGFSAVTGYHLPYGAHFDGRVDYLPAVDDFTGNYLLRSQAGLTFPLIDPIAAKFSVLDEYNAVVANDTDHNSLWLTIGLSLLW